jgi:hypothetical protein
MKNSQEDELKRQKRSLQGKIERRRGSIVLAQRDIREYALRLAVIEKQLEEYKKMIKFASNLVFVIVLALLVGSFGFLIWAAMGN